jgi:hypothetical protein
MTASVHPAATHHLPMFITAPGHTDVLMVTMAVVLAVIVVMFGVFYFWLHSLPERIAHRNHKIQFEIVAVLGLISLFTHMHIFWIVGLLLAFIDLPDFGTPLGRIAGGVEKIAGIRPGQETTDLPSASAPDTHQAQIADELHEHNAVAAVKSREQAAAKHRELVAAGERS